MAPNRYHGQQVQYAPDAVQVVNNPVLATAYDLERQLRLGFGGKVCEYAVDKYHHFDDMVNSQPDANVHIRRLYFIGKYGAGQATKIVCNLDNIDNKLKELRGRANEYKEADLVVQYQNFLKQLGHLKADAAEVLIEVAPQKAITMGDKARAAAKALRRKRGEGEAAAV